VPYQQRFLDRVGVHNITCYVSAAVVGHLLGREEWVQRGLHAERTGSQALLRGGVLADGRGEPDGWPRTGVYR